MTEFKELKIQYSDFTVSLFEKGIETKLSLNKSQIYAANNELLILDFAYELGYRGCFPAIDPHYIKDELGGLQYFKECKQQDFLVMYQNSEFIFAMGLDESVLPVVGAEVQSFENNVDYIRRNGYPPFDDKLTPMLYKRFITQVDLKEMKESLEYSVNAYKDPTHSSHYRHQWALNNLTVVEQLIPYIGQTVLVSIDTCYSDGSLRLMGIDSWDGLNDEEYLLDLYINLK
jgi:hypothetical protein